MEYNKHKGGGKTREDAKRYINIHNGSATMHAIYWITS